MGEAEKGAGQSTEFVVEHYVERAVISWALGSYGRLAGKKEYA